jgi:hypothetical protein
MKRTALLGALLLSAAAPPALAQYDADSESVEDHLSMAPTREITQACKAEAAQRSLSGGDRRTFMKECQKRPVTSGSSGMSYTSGPRKLTAMRDADGRFPPDNVTPSHWSRMGPSPDGTRSAIPDVDAEGRPRLTSR